MMKLPEVELLTPCRTPPAHGIIPASAPAQVWGTGIPKSSEIHKPRPGSMIVTIFAVDGSVIVQIKLALSESTGVRKSC